MKRKLFLTILIVTLVAGFLYARFPLRAYAKNSAPTEEESDIWVIATDDYSVTIGWKPIDGADLYRVFKWAPGDNWIVEDPTGTSGTTYHDVTLNCRDASTDYGDFYIVRAYDTANQQMYETGWVQGAPLNDDFAKAIPITQASIPTTETLFTCNANKYTDNKDPEITECNLGKGATTVWYQFSPTVNQAVSFDTSGTDYDDAFIAVWSGGPDDYTNGTLRLIGCSKNNPSVAFQAMANTNYYIEIGQPENLGTASLELLMPPLSTKAGQ